MVSIFRHDTLEIKQGGEGEWGRPSPLGGGHGVPPQAALSFCCKKITELPMASMAGPRDVPQNIA